MARPPPDHFVLKHPPDQVAKQTNERTKQAHEQTSTPRNKQTNNMNPIKIQSLTSNRNNLIN